MNKRLNILFLLIIGFSIESNINSMDYLQNFHKEKHPYLATAILASISAWLAYEYITHDPKKEFEKAQGEPVVGFVYSNVRKGNGERLRVKCLFKKDQMMFAEKYPLEDGDGDVIEAGTVFKVGQSFDHYPPLTKKEILEMIADSIQDKLEDEKNISAETDDNFMNTLFAEVTTVLIDLGYTVEVRSDGTVMIDNIVM